MVLRAPGRRVRLGRGEQTDTTTGLESLRARYYDPGTGGFISRDAYAGSGGRPSSQNRFAYVEATREPRGLFGDVPGG